MTASRSRDHLYRMIEDYMRHALFDTGGQWRTADPADLTARAMATIRAGLNPQLDSAAVSDAIETIRHAADRGLPIQLDGRGPWYRLTECDPPTKSKTKVKVLAPPEPEEKTAPVRVDDVPLSDMPA